MLFELRTGAIIYWADKLFLILPKMQSDRSDPGHITQQTAKQENNTADTRYTVDNDTLGVLSEICGYHAREKTARTWVMCRPVWNVDGFEALAPKVDVRSLPEGTKRCGRASF